MSDVIPDCFCGGKAGVDCKMHACFDEAIAQRWMRNAVPSTQDEDGSQMEKNARGEGYVVRRVGVRGNNCESVRKQVDEDKEATKKEKHDK